MRIGIIIISICALQSCRKEIVHVPGITSSDGEDDTTQTGTSSSWTAVTSETGLDLLSIEVFNNEIYVGGNFELFADSLEGFVKLNSQGQVVQAAPGNWYFGGVTDMEVINNELYVSGAFSYFNLPQLISAYSFFKMDAGGIISEVEITTEAFDNIRDITEFNGGIVVSGYFTPDTDNSFVTGNVDFLQNEVPQGLAVLDAHVYQTVVHEGVLFAVGNEIILKKWDGAAWNDEIYYQPHWQDEVYALASFESELYILGNFQNGVLLKKMDAGGVWSNVSDITSLGTPSFMDDIVVVDGKLYVLGSGMQLDGVLSSNVISFDGVEWTAIGNMTSSARDMTSKDGKLVLATDNGVYEIDK
ncbi:MAG: hypothetical protein ACI857_001968 [Arenicella sp.]